MREYRLLSQQQRKDVAEMLGIGPGTLSNWEYGRSPFTTDYLVKFAHILNLEVVLFDRAEFQRVYPDHYERVKRL
jgi:transcriptional regulator with XRE-family HTH domain